MNVVSLFDGISCAKLALDKAGFKDYFYISSEIDRNAILVSEDNHSNICRMGDVALLDGREIVDSVGEVALLIGGSPCQSFSSVGKREGFEGKSGLLLHFIRILEETNPKYFLLENVIMSPLHRDRISKLLNVDPIIIDSNLVSFQNRKRLYWTNIPVKGIKDREIYLKDYHCKEYDDSLILKGLGLNKLSRKRARIIDINGLKTKTLLASQRVKPTDALVFKIGENLYRYPTRREMELMQTVPIGYTNILGYNMAAEVLGNAFTVDIIAEILKGIVREMPKWQSPLPRAESPKNDEN